jgi:hypothetical protein
LFLILSELVRLSAPKGGKAQIWDQYAASPDTVGVKAPRPVPRFEKKRTVSLSAFPVPGCEEAREFIAQNE